LLRLGAALIVAAAVVLIVQAAQPSAAPSRVGTAGPEPYPPRVTLIADSVGGVLFWAVPQRDELARGLDLRLEVKTCRKLVGPGCYAFGEVPSSALDVVTTVGPELGHLVVVDVGYNDPAEGYAANLDAVMAALVAAGVEHVIWVTLRETEVPWVQINEQIRAATGRWPQLIIADWASIAQAHPAWFVDEAHMNELGAEGFVGLLRPAIFAACGNPCFPPEASATIAGLVSRPGQVTLRWRGNAFARTYDVAVRPAGGAWRILAARLVATSYRLRGARGARMQVRVRARDDADLPGVWSPPRAFRF
jgi:hypothetical protein